MNRVICDICGTEYPENAERLQALIVEAIREAVEEATIVEEQYSWAFISEDLCLGC